MKPRLLHVGSAVVDYVYRLDRLPAAGSEKVASSHTRLVGGGFNMMVAAQRTGMDVAFGGQHGSGPDGDFLRATLAAAGIDVLNPAAPTVDSGNCVVLVTGDAERTFVSWPGAEAHVTAAMLAPLKPRPQDWAFISGYTLSYPGSREALADWIEALPQHVPFVFDPTPVVGDIPGPILSRVLARTSWLSCNEAEAAAIAGAGDIETVSARLLAAHCTKADGIVVRAGEAGCLMRLANGAAQVVPGFAVEAVDTNGAGDTHIGAFISALARGAHPFEAARYANAAAAIAVTRHGGSSAPTHDEIEEFLRAADGPASSRMVGKAEPETEARNRED